MAVNKNFVVKNGLEVDTNTLFVDSANNRVAIGTTVPTAALTFVEKYYQIVRLRVL